MAAAVAMETDDAGNRLRFQLELEFVQCLANPNYLNFLAQRGYFKDKAFVNYLKYLLYWKEPEYAKYLNCLHFNTRHIISNLTGITTVSTHWYSSFLPALPNKEEPFSTQKPTWSLKNRNYIPLEPFGRFPLHAEENLVS
ncbi:hypothetical protein CapIbe_016540 [Capra ibex]